MQALSSVHCDFQLPLGVLLSSSPSSRSLFTVSWPRFPSPRSARLLLYGSIDLPHSRPEPEPLSPPGLPTPLLPQSFKKYTGKDLKRRRPTFDYSRIRASVARRRQLDGKPSLSQCAGKEGIVGKSSPVRSSPPPPPPPPPSSTSLPLRGCLKVPGLNLQKTSDRHVRFGDVSVKVVDRWLMPRLRCPFPPPPHACFPPGARHLGRRVSPSPRPPPSFPSLSDFDMHKSQRLRSGKYLEVSTSRPNPGFVIGLILLLFAIVSLLNAVALRFGFMF